VIAEAVSSKQDFSAIPWWDPEEEMARLLQILERAYSGMLGAINALVAAYFDVDPDEFVVDDATTNRILQQAATRVVRITETTRQSISKTLQDGQARGYNNWQLAHGVAADNFAGIDGLFKETWKNRALVVARTELQHAQLAAALERYLASGVVDRVKLIDGCQWDAACCERNGKIVPIEQAPRLNHPNCTLVLIPLLREGVAPLVAQPEPSEQPVLL
jgi:hypothetical protein